MTITFLEDVLASVIGFLPVAAYMWHEHFKLKRYVKELESEFLTHCGRCEARWDNDIEIRERLHDLEERLEQQQSAGTTVSRFGPRKVNIGER